MKLHTCRILLLQQQQQQQQLLLLLLLLPTQGLDRWLRARTPGGKAYKGNEMSLIRFGSRRRISLNQGRGGRKCLQEVCRTGRGWIKEPSHTKLRRLSERPIKTMEWVKSEPCARAEARAAKTITGVDRAPTIRRLVRPDTKRCLALLTRYGLSEPGCRCLVLNSRGVSPSTSGTQVHLRFSLRRVCLGRPKLEKTHGPRGLTTGLDLLLLGMLLRLLPPHHYHCHYFYHYHHHYHLPLPLPLPLPTTITITATTTIYYLLPTTFYPLPRTTTTTTTTAPTTTTTSTATTTTTTTNYYHLPTYLPTYYY